MKVIKLISTGTLSKVSNEEAMRLVATERYTYSTKSAFTAAMNKTIPKHSAGEPQQFSRPIRRIMSGARRDPNALPKKNTVTVTKKRIKNPHYRGIPIVKVEGSYAIGKLIAGIMAGVPAEQIYWMDRITTPNRSEEYLARRAKTWYNTTLALAKKANQLTGVKYL